MSAFSPGPDLAPRPPVARTLDGMILDASVRKSPLFYWVP